MKNAFRPKAGLQNSFNLFAMLLLLGMGDQSSQSMGFNQKAPTLAL